MYYSKSHIIINTCKVLFSGFKHFSYCFCHFLGGSRYPFCWFLFNSMAPEIWWVPLYNPSEKPAHKNFIMLSSILFTRSAVVQLLVLAPSQNDWERQQFWISLEHRGSYSSTTKDLKDFRTALGNGKDDGISVFKLSGQVFWGWLVTMCLLLL